MINKVSFPEYTNAQINAALLADKLNEVIDFINGATIEREYEEVSHLKPGVRITKNGLYHDGKKFIKKEDAYV